MRMQFSNLRLARRMGAYYRRPLAVLVAIVFVFSAALGGAAVTQLSIERAAQNGVAEQLAHSDHVVQPTTAVAAAEGKKISDWFAAKDVEAEVSYGNALIEMPVRIVANQELEFGRLVEGDRPEDAGELLISRSAAQALAVEPGDTIELSLDGEAQKSVVSGVVVDSGDSSAEQGYLLGDVGDHPSLFLMDIDPVEAENTAVLFEEAKFTYTSKRELARFAADDSMTELASGFRTALFLLASALAVLLPVSVWTIGQTLRPSLRSLTATGLNRRRQVGVLAWLLGLPTGLASLIGIGSAALLLWAARTNISTLFGQDWAGIAFGGTTLMLPVVVTISAVLVGVATTRSRPDSLWRLKIHTISIDRPRAAGVFSILFFTLSAVLTWAAAKSYVPPDFAVPVLFLAVVSLTWVVSALLRTKLLSRTLRKASQPAGIVVLFATLLTSLILTNVIVFAARSVHEFRTAAADSFRTIPVGSLAIDSIPSAPADQLSEKFESYGGDEPRSFSLPLERQRQLRIISEDTAECLAEHHSQDVLAVGELCGTEPLVSYVVFDEKLSGEVVVAPEYGSNGSAFFVVYEDDVDEASQIRRIENVRVDPSLAVPLAGAVASKNWAYSEELGLTASDLRQIVFKDFAKLSGGQQAEFRMLIRKLAPAAETVEIRDNQRFDQTELLVATGIVTGGLISLLLIFATFLSLAALQETRRQFHLFGVSVRLRRQLTMTVFLQWAFVGLTSVGGGLAIAWMVGAKDGLGFGLLWAVPVVILLPAFFVALQLWNSRLTKLQ